MPESPRAWLFTVASRRLTDIWRSENARRNRESTGAALSPVDEPHLPAPEEDRPAEEEDDTLTLLFLCCHPALSPASQVALADQDRGRWNHDSIEEAVGLLTDALRTARSADRRTPPPGSGPRPPPGDGR